MPSRSTKSKPLFSRDTLFFVAAVFSIPLVELFSLHQMVHYVLGRNNTVLGFYGRDIYVPVILGAVLGLAHLHRTKAFEFKLQPNTLAVNLSLFVLLSLSLLRHDALVAQVGSEVWVAWLMGGTLAMLVTSLAVFIAHDVLIARIRAYGARLLYLIGALGALFLYPTILAWVWPWLVRATGYSVYAVLNLMGMGVTKFAVKQNIGIVHPSMRVSIGMGCSGLEGIFFFLFAFSLVLLFARQPLNLRRSIFAVVAGISFMFILNVIRIVLFFSVAVMINGMSVEPHGRRFFKWAFHENIGWLLYLVGLAVFFHFVNGAFLAGARSRAASRAPS